MSFSFWPTSLSMRVSSSIHVIIIILFHGWVVFHCVCILHLFLFLYIYIFLLHIMVTQLHIHVYILFFSHYVLHHNWLDRVPSATQQDPIANPSQKQNSVSIYPKLPVPPLPPWQPQVYSPSPWFSFLWKGSFVLYIRFQL